MGTIIKFDSFTHPSFGEQHTVIVRLAESNELVSGFLNSWLQEGLSRKQAGERFIRYHLEIEKAQPEMF